MYNYLLVAISCLCFLPPGFHAEECIETVLGRRETLYVPVGGSLSLSCVVQHCEDTWTGEWIWRNSTEFNELRVITESDRHQMTNVTLSVNETRMLLRFLSVNEFDEGSYGCKVTWGNGGTAQGSVKYLNVTAGFHAEECSETVLARRETFYVPVGGNLSLSCVVQHCGDTWTGEWVWRNSIDNERVITEGDRHQMTNVTLSVNKAQMSLRFLSVNEVDEGSYGCKVIWGKGGTAQGHLTYLNIIAADPSQNNMDNRIFVYAGAFICLPIILVLACFLSSELKPQPLPRTLQPSPQCPVPQKCSTSSLKATPKSLQMTEVVYSVISKAALDQQQATRGPAQSTVVYSSLWFSQNQSKAEE